MKMIRNSAFLFGMLVAVPAMALAQGTAGKAPASKTAPAKPAKAAAKEAVHVTKGVVKSVDAASLVITNAGKDMTFMLNAATQKTGTVAMGSNVDVRYTTDAGKNTATAVTVKAAAKKK